MQNISSSRALQDLITRHGFVATGGYYSDIATAKTFMPPAYNNEDNKNGK